MYQTVFSTCPDQQSAVKIANTLVEKKLAACVNILPNVVSIYRWQQQIEQATEVMMMIKTTSQQLAELTSAIKQLHPYDVPEIITVNIQQGDNDYLNWISDSLK